MSDASLPGFQINASDGTTATLTRKLRRRLDELRRREMAAAHEELLRAIARPPLGTGEVRDLGEQSAANALADDDNAVARRRVQAIRDIDEALARLEQGGFGICAECGDRVAAARLLACPTARRCATCQEAYEHTFAGMHPSSL
jgi:RNA polymerase-binding transcription factor DksA